MSAVNSTADRAIDILLLFEDDRPIRTVAEIAAALGTTRSTTYRYLRGLRAAGLVEEAGDGAVRLGPRVFQLARIARKGMGVLELAQPVLGRLSRELGETVLFSRRSGREVVVLECIESPHPMRISYERGHILPIPAGATAKVFLAFAEPGEADALLGEAALTRYTTQTVVDLDELRRQIDKARQDGFALNDGELDDGVRAVAAPVFSRDGRVRYAVAVVAPGARVPDATLPRIVGEVRGAGQEISRRLGEIGL